MQLFTQEVSASEPPADEGVVELPPEESDDVEVVLVEQQADSTDALEKLVSETLNCGTVDSGCSSTVCGHNWLRCYFDILPEQVVKNIEKLPTKKAFKFGDSRVFPSSFTINLPVVIGGLQAHILTDVIKCEIPLLLSKACLKAAQSQLDFVNDQITMLGRKIDLQCTSNGHYCIPLSPKQVAVNHGTVNVTLSVNNLEEKTVKEKHDVALKLHKQFGHPCASKLKTLVSNTSIHNNELLHKLDEVSDNCDTCLQYNKARSRPIVSLPLASDVNDCLAMDVKFLTINDRN